MAVKNTKLGGSDWINGTTLSNTDLNDTFDACTTLGYEFYTLISTHTITGSTLDLTLEKDSDYILKLTTGERLQCRINSDSGGNYTYQETSNKAVGSISLGDNQFELVDDANEGSSSVLKIHSQQSSTDYYISVRCEYFGRDGNVYGVCGETYGGYNVAVTTNYVLNIAGSSFSSFTGTARLYKVTDSL